MHDNEANVGIESVIASNPSESACIIRPKPPRMIRMLAHLMTTVENCVFPGGLQWNVPEQPSEVVPPKPEPAPARTPPPFWRTVSDVVVIGVHGWAVLGGIGAENPLNTSAKFCEQTVIIMNSITLVSFSTLIRWLRYKSACVN